MLFVCFVHFRHVLSFLHLYDIVLFVILNALLWSEPTERVTCYLPSILFAMSRYDILCSPQRATANRKTMVFQMLTNVATLLRERGRLDVSGVLMRIDFSFVAPHFLRHFAVESSLSNLVLVSPFAIYFANLANFANFVNFVNFKSILNLKNKFLENDCIMYLVLSNLVRFKILKPKRSIENSI